MSTLNRTSQVVVFDDLPASNTPQRRSVDWRRALQSIPVTKPQTQTIQIDALSETTVFDGTRTLTFDGTTQLALTLSDLDPSRYRLAWTGVGTAVGFRTNRNLTLSAGSVTLTLQANSTVVVTHDAGAVFGAVVVGDAVYIPGVITGDTGLFNSLNEGLWTVLSAAAGSLTIARLPGTVFSGATETVALSDNDQFQAYSSSGVQVGDTLDISGGFSTSSRTSYKVSSVTAKTVEFISTSPLALETIIPGINSVKVYSAAKKYLMIESDQALAIKCNGSTDETNRIEPISSGNPNLVAFSEKWGTTYSLVLKNRTTVRANVLVISAE